MFVNLLEVVQGQVQTENWRSSHRHARSRGLPSCQRRSGRSRTDWDWDFSGCYVLVCVSGLACWSAYRLVPHGNGLVEFL
ncbi:hypothetical protein CYLTODRAFT_168256 [Cylindrobasidium torrendii FP15055 ss-10]|uniref:Uncharacterized protein n=1 Tax=Cylindrobasidium torrendii FP15055 ss-10 TaxID=1314674 RepID=A0A0D7BMG2_9AGAR|nr:hypothetical protein CYLTODRAFT_168256 [Cylindrobasidium torrendii FP15055 ss-10]